MKKSLRLNRGVTLMELMVVMSIIGILSAIAIPTYMQYTVRTHRAAARACLSEASQFMERYYTTNLTYVDADGGDGILGLGCEVASGLDERYEIRLADDPAVTQRTFTLVATPIDSQADRDTGCGALTLNEIGARGAGDNSAATIAKCW
jgi:type IV pilus assembly protein PilE